MEPSTYLLKKGTVLYRGDTPFYLYNKDKPIDSLSLEKKPTFFGSDPDDVAQYGIIYGWVVSDDIELPLLDNHDVMTEIYNGATPEVQKVMKDNYGYRDDGFKNRVSIFEKDIIFYQYLCDKGYPGYASHDLEEGVRTSIEIMVCNPTGYTCSGVVYPSETGDKELYMNNQVEKYKKRIREKEEGEDNGRKKSRNDDFNEYHLFGDSPVKGNNMFGDSPLKGNNMFGDSPVKGNNMFGQSPIKGNNMFGQSPLKGNNMFGHSPLKGNKMFGDSPLKGNNMFGDSPLKGNKMFGDSPVKRNNLFASPKKGGKKSKRGKSKRNRKLRKTRRRY